MNPAETMPTTVALLAVTIGARGKKPMPQPVPVQAPPAINADRDRTARERLSRQAAADAGARRRADSIAAAGRAVPNAAASAHVTSELNAPVHFDYDQSELRADDRAILDAKVPILQVNTGVTIRVSVHTGERGSDEYKPTLTGHRAAAAKAYLVQHGIAAARVETVSYGEERPAALGNNESVWAQNRRDEFEVIAGAQTIRRP